MKYKISLFCYHLNFIYYILFEWNIMSFEMSIKKYMYKILIVIESRGNVQSIL